MAKTRIHFRGTAQVAANLRTLVRAVPAAVGRALREEAEIEMTEAKERTPVDTGALRASGHVEGPDHQGRAISVDLNYGGPSAPYAVYVHEDLEAHHPVGQAKFLESTLLESAPHLPRRIAARVSRYLQNAV
jgi:hypothetical protein